MNTDVVLALDTTLSMYCSPSDCALTYCASEKSDAKIKALRAAVTAFYNAMKPAQDELEGQGLRLRYGIVPFSETVSVGNLLRATDASWVNDTWNYDKCTSPSSKSLTQTLHDFSRRSPWDRVLAPSGPAGMDASRNGRPSRRSMPTRALRRHQTPMIWTLA